MKTSTKIVFFLFCALLIGFAVVRVRQLGDDRSFYCNRATQFVLFVRSNDSEHLLPLLDSAMTATLWNVPPSNLWLPLTSRYGNVKSFGEAKKSSVGLTTLVTIPCQFDYSNVDIRVYLNQAGKVCGFFFFKRNETVHGLKKSNRESKEIHIAISDIDYLAHKNNDEFTKSLGQDMAGYLDAQAQNYIWQEIENKYGRYQKVVTATHVSVNDCDTVTTICQFSRSKAKIEINFNLGGQVTGLKVKDVA